MKIDMHVHTCYSFDAISAPKDIVKTALKKKLDGIAVTDHNTIKAWKDFRELSKKTGIKIIFGEEIKIIENGGKRGEVLGFFLNEFVAPGSLEEVTESIKSQAGVSVVAHPFNTLNKFKRINGVERFVNGIEGFNSRVFSSENNKKAMEFAKKTNLSVTGGSDAHIRFQIGNGVTCADVSGLEDFRKALLKRKTKVYGKKSSALWYIVPGFAKIKNFRFYHPHSRILL